MAASSWLDLSLDLFHQAIADLFDDPQKRDLNLRAFDAGIKGFTEAAKI